MLVKEVIEFIRDGDFLCCCGLHSADSDDDGSAGGHEFSSNFTVESVHCSFSVRVEVFGIHTPNTIENNNCITTTKLSIVFNPKFVDRSGGNPHWPINQLAASYHIWSTEC